ncbi:3(2),5-bisphosphate nucleotidase HAL2 [Ascobolus immersus RN42]|uniref:3'(2'),5'-bisphosphate nucleotidase n=1 Tax=Ascobolus immersus RN42 TaxID=1160509 RepID=A0A3N4I550_ASCIM|nr:3(2),5-bisphosphate nucleotidase HAL2 [Ascobolus immersus RN42]
MSYERERLLAELAVQRACMLTDRVFHQLVKTSVSKDDKSPVTVADYAAQALIIASVNAAFPGDGIVGEEDSAFLRKDEKLRGIVWNLVKETLEAAGEAKEDIPLGNIKDEQELMDTIDKGLHEGGRSGRVWALDPIDGTKGFLRGGQYAVCLGLLVDGKATVGALGVPNLPQDPSNPEGPKGVLLSAIRGQGAVIRDLSPNLTLLPSRQLEPVKPTNVADCAFCEGVESGHSNHGQQANIASSLGITKESIRYDSQAKYAAIARGDAQIYLRLPSAGSNWVEKIWDHAAGSLICEEVGYTVSDVNGTPLDFGMGRTLKSNKGIVAAAGPIYDDVIAAVKKELGSQ